LRSVVTPDPNLDRAELTAAAGAAGNIPCHRAVPYRLTGDRKWLEAPYRSARTRGSEELNDDGLPEEIHAELRQLDGPQDHTLLGLAEFPDQIVGGQRDGANHRRQPATRRQDPPSGKSP
jgi:hypothetical protein